MSVKKLTLHVNQNRLKVAPPDNEANGYIGYGNIYYRHHRKDCKVIGPYYWQNIVCFYFPSNVEYCLNGFLIRVSERI